MINRNSLIASMALCLVGLGTAASARCRVVAYVPNWIDLDSFSEKIEYDKITHINVAFENPTKAAGDLSFNEKNRVLIAKAQKHNVKILISIGGGGQPKTRR